MKAAIKSQPTGEPRNTRSGNNSINLSPAKISKVATQNQRRQQQKSKSPTTPNNTLSCLKQTGTKKRPRTSKVSPGEIFEQRPKLVSLQNSKEFATNRSFIQLDRDSVQQIEHNVTYEIENDTDTPHKILTSSYPIEFMITSPNSPLITNIKEKSDNQANESTSYPANQHEKLTEPSKRCRL